MGFPPGDGAPAEDAGGGAPAEVAGGGAYAEEAPAPAGGGAPAREAAGTGDPRVDEAVRRFDELPVLPVGEHPAVFEYVHERLIEVLGDLDVGPGASGEARGPSSTGR